MITNPTFSCSGMTLSRVWHCFGTHRHVVDLGTVIAMLDASETNVLPINTHNLTHAAMRDGLQIGFGDVRYDDLRASRDTESMVRMLNINHQTTAEAAVTRAMLAVEATGETVLKLEVLHPNLQTSDNVALIDAVGRLAKWHGGLQIMPLLACDADDARRLVDLSCPLLRVMGSPIGSGAGITAPDAFAEICSLGVPVVLDGGVGSAQDLATALSLGADGCLVNSMLFEAPAGPAATLKSFMQDIQPRLATSMSPV